MIAAPARRLPRATLLAVAWAFVAAHALAQTPPPTGGPDEAGAAPPPAPSAPSDEAPKDEAASAATPDGESSEAATPDAANPSAERPPSDATPDGASLAQPTAGDSLAKPSATTPTPALREDVEVADLHLDEYEFDPDELCPFCEITPQWPEGRRGLHWHDHWDPVGWPEYIATPLLWAGTLSMDLFLPNPTEARWSSPILFDESVRDALVAETAAGQSRTDVASDVLFYASVAYPVVIDNFLVAWIGRQSPRVAWQLFVINAQSYGLASFLNSGVKRLAARERPWGTNCPNPVNHDCSAGTRYRSFYSGHATITATGAGLTCAHHTQLSLYKNPIMDTSACLAAVGFTAATGALRMSSDNHWATDVLTGHLMGYLVGYLFPTLMYYKEFRFSPEEHHHEHPSPQEPQGPIWALLPMVHPDSLQVAGVGVF